MAGRSIIRIESAPPYDLCRGAALGDCKASGDGQVSINGKQATYAITSGFDCISRDATLTGVVLTQRGNCELLLEAYASDVEIENGVPAIRNTYLKSGCTP